jgi:hypothetical protein
MDNLETLKHKTKNCPACQADNSGTLVVCALCDNHVDRSKAFYQYNITYCSFLCLRVIRDIKMEEERERREREEKETIGSGAFTGSFNSGGLC